MEVKENLSVIKENIHAACRRSGRDPKEVQLVAVTKYVTAERAEEAIAAGIFHLGENRDEGLSEKFETIGTNAVWHFIGSLQTRKVKNIIDKVSYIHSLDRLSLAKEIDKRASAPVDCFVQVNTSGEESKHGLKPEEVIPFIKKCSEYPAVRIAGLMTMAPNTDDTSIIRRTFQRLRAIKEEAQQLGLNHAPCTELSMGMSNDYQIAIEEGATFIRIGSSLVG
ncbi:YggS family pyridoxal phosphate-dependent enzyme [Bacillus sp. FJAT-42376]|uniref:YggS family pyridoxal phosphate-dependent enzyme n=1 Tax=Bacillus sp. FJAT-42376 TaxID=2014076 RepID=UPI000F4EEE70|nr:YggS family pyridoxal phosphate-dependent enzyme [Bacillus sp. FJAT-42376]AZB42851.1 YggS family pyridoxal phosphate-dependent enzyme [Bacillus sp. FJAT-42376]